MRAKHPESFQGMDEYEADILDSLGDALIAVDGEFRVVYANKEICRLLGQGVNDLVGKDIVDLIPEAGGWMFHRHLEKALSERSQVTLDNFRFKNKRFTTHFFPNGNGTTILLHDITTQWHVDELYRLALFLLDKLNESICLVRSDGRLFHVNDEIIRLLGYPRDELIHMKIFDIDPNITADGWESYFTRIKDKVHVDFESTLRARDSKNIPVDISANYVQLYGNEYYCVAVRDITERKRAEEALRKAHVELDIRVRERTSELQKTNEELKDQIVERMRSENALRESKEELQRANRALKALSKCKEAMIRAGDEASLLNDICHIIVDVGGYRLAWIGYLENDEVRTVRPVARAGYDEGYVDNLKIALDDPIRGNGPTGISLKTGKPYVSRNLQTDSIIQPWRREALKRGYLSTLNLPILYEKQMLGALVIYSDRLGGFEEEEQGLLLGLADNLAYGIKAIRDCAGRDQAEKELLRAKDELEIRVRERTEELRLANAQAETYLDLMSHDINNLNQIALGYLELAENMLEDQELRELISKPLDAINSSSHLIENVNKLKKLKTGGFNVDAIDLDKVLKELRSNYSKVPDKDVTIDYRGPDSTCNVMANGLIKDLFSNLIWNAIKHSNRSSVEINMDLKRLEEDGAKYYKVVVEDNGPGIPDAQKEKIFARFQRGNTKTTGKGLGLYLVRTLVEDFHGRVWVEDCIKGDHTKGARFVVVLPAVEKS